MEAAFSGENVQIICSAVDGNPDVHNFTLIKSDVQLMVSTQTNSLIYNTNDAFGVYACLVESLYTTATKSLFLQERG